MEREEATALGPTERAVHPVPSRCAGAPSFPTTPRSSSALPSSATRRSVGREVFSQDQLASAGQARGVQAHTLGASPPQVSRPEQVPQWRKPSHPFGRSPRDPGA